MQNQTLSVKTLKQKFFGGVRHVVAHRYRNAVRGTLKEFYQTKDEQTARELETILKTNLSCEAALSELIRRDSFVLFTKEPLSLLELRDIWKQGVGCRIVANYQFEDNDNHSEVTSYELFELRVENDDDAKVRTRLREIYQPIILNRRDTETLTEQQNKILCKLSTVIEEQTLFLKECVTIDDEIDLFCEDQNDNVELFMAIEQTFNVRIPLETSADLITVFDVIEYLQSLNVN